MTSKKLPTMFFGISTLQTIKFSRETKMIMKCPRDYTWPRTTCSILILCADMRNLAKFYLFSGDLSNERYCVCYFCLFIIVCAIFQLSGGYHLHWWQGCKFRPTLTLIAFGSDTCGDRGLWFIQFLLIRRTGSRVPHMDSNPRRKGHRSLRRRSNHIFTNLLLSISSHMCTCSIHRATRAAFYCTMQRF
jgi:hypothetical protein